MIIIDSSGWLEYFTGGKKAAQFAKIIVNRNKTILVPAICMYEVFKKVLSEMGESTALLIHAQMNQHTVIPLDERIAIHAAKVSVEKKLSMADAIIYTIATDNQAELWTMDKDFKSLPNVKYIPNK